MGLSDFIPVIIPYLNIHKEKYQEIIASLGLTEPIIIEKYPLKSEWRKDLANAVASRVGDKKSLIFGERHYLITYCYNDSHTALITFDAHNDSFPLEKRLLYDEEISNDISNGDFLLQRKGETHIIGTRIKSDVPRIKTYPPRKRKAYKLLKDQIPNKIFLSLEIDVFDPEITQAHYYPHDSIIDEVAKFFGYRRFLNFEECCELSISLIRNREVVGINIAGYAPECEGPPFKTVELIKEYLNRISPYL